jgi:hypothetical protein
VQAMGVDPPGEPISGLQRVLVCIHYLFTVPPHVWA